ncbi:heat shock factor protein 1 isoform X2 [Nelusetta ayraudi]|uniref:heat shock factor protein 1 isoform X2 n=1 Tax=Nelusetta ayraudi TaxID=303726 RepID=UPI003F6F0B1E
MDHLGGGAGAVLSGANVPAFLTKLWTLVEDPDTDPLICWSPSGTSFHVFDQGRFSKEVLPKFFKHNNMASFIRQLNMYGFRKVVHIEQGGLVKPERDDTEFQHPFFLRGQENLLENIKRKVTTVSSVRQEEVKMSTEEVNKILSDVQLMKGKQETIDSRIATMRHENEALWREVALLRQKHNQQQKVVNKLIQFLVSLVQSNRILGVKRKLPLMLNDSSSAHSMPKYSRPFSLEAANLFSPDSLLTSGPIISEVATPPTIAGEGEEEEEEEEEEDEEEVVRDHLLDSSLKQPVSVKEEPSSPGFGGGGVSPVDTPLSPTTFINSILQEETTPPPSSTSTGGPPTTAGSPLVAMSSTGPLPPPAASQSPAGSSSGGVLPGRRCQTVACLDRDHMRTLRWSPAARGAAEAQKSQLSDHVDCIDTSLENLQSILNTQTFTFDPSPLMEFFSSPGPTADFDIDSLDTLLFGDTPRGGDENSNSNSQGKQLVHYTATPLLLPEPITLAEGGADLPSLLELEGEPLFSGDPPPDELGSALMLRPPHP